MQKNKELYDIIIIGSGNMDNIEQLIQSLKSADFITWGLLKDYYEKNVFGPKERNQLEIINKRLYTLFIKSIDKESSSRLKQLDKLIDMTIKKIEGNSDWVVSENSAILTDNFQNMEDAEFRTWDTYTILRNDAMGFYVPDDNKDFNEYFKNIYQKSSYFLEEHTLEFEELNNLVIEKTSIMRGNYSYRANNIDMNLIRLISEFLGYNADDSLNAVKTQGNDY